MRVEAARARIGVVIADDHPVVRSGLRRILERGGVTEVLGEASDGEALLGLVEKLSPDVAVIDISMPLLNGIDATLAIRAHHPTTRVLILSMHCRQAMVMDAIEAGAMGYVLKDAADDELERAVLAVAQQKGYFSPAIATLVSARLAARGPHAAPHLSTRERQVLQLISEGRPPREIATQLFISPQTVKTHRSNAMRKLGVRTTAGLIRYAIMHGLASV